MKKAQVTFFFILGIMLVLSMLFLVFLILQKEQIYTSEAKKTFLFSDVKTDADRYIKECIDEAATTSIQDTGIRGETLDKYKALIEKGIDSCVQPILETLRAQKYEVSEGSITVKVTQSPETIQVDIVYPILIQKDEQRINLNEFHYTFDRSTSVNIPGGITNKEIHLVSANQKATLIIPSDVKITDEEGKPIEKIGIKLEDLHFDGLENKYSLGQVAYDGFPDGARFSKPVELSIEFREQDILPGYTKENLYISYWNEKAGIWYAIPTVIKGNKATANITHFTPYLIKHLTLQVVIDHIFRQRYYPYSATNQNEDRTTPEQKIWLIGGELTGVEGKASLISGYSKSIFNIETSDYKFAGDYRDFLTEHADEYKLNLPEITYGYYESALLLSSSFINCEEEGVKNNIYFGLDAEGDPYFKNLDYINQYSCGRTCPECYSGDCTCSGATVCGYYGKTDTDGDGKGDTPAYCIYNKEKTSCVEQETVPISSSYSQPVFGYHNYRCSGGKVRPAEGEAYSDILAFEPNGNSAILISIANFLFTGSEDTPAVLMFNYPPLIWPDFSVLKNGFGGELDGLEGLFIPPGEGYYPFYCKAVSNSEGALALGPQQFTLSSGPIYDRLKSEFSEVTPMSGNPPISGFGIYGFDIVRHTIFPKNDMRAKCDNHWFFFGSGNIVSTDPYRAVGFEQVFEQDESVVYNNLDENGNVNIRDYLLNYVSDR